MLKPLFQTLIRNPAHLLEDVIGVAAIFVILFVGLSVSGLG